MLKVEVKETQNYLKSLYATQEISTDEVVFTACGAVVKTATRYTYPIDCNLYLDPVSTNNPARYLCHSCEPNCGIKNRTQIVAMRNIKAGEEVTIDYAMIVPQYKEEMTPQTRTCNCGSDICRGQLGAYEDLPEDIRDSYAGYISDYLIN